MERRATQAMSVSTTTLREAVPLPYILPLLSGPRHRLCLVFSHRLRGQDTAVAFVYFHRLRG